MKRSLFFTGLFLSSCSLFKKQSLNEKMLNEKEGLHFTEDRQVLSQQSEVVLTDSSDTDFMITLWPKGKFTYSLAKGFEGETERIVIKGKNTQVKVLETTQQTQHDYTSLKSNYSKEKEIKKTVQQHKERLGFDLGWFLVVVLVLAIFFVYRKFKS